MKRRSISAFVVSLIAGLTIIIFGHISSLLFGLVAGLAEESSDTFTLLHTVSCYLKYAGAVLAIIGGAMCFTKSKAGGVVLFISTIILLIFPILNTILIVMTKSFESMLVVAVTYVPALLVLISAILAVKGRVIQQLIKEESMDIEA